MHGKTGGAIRWRAGRARVLALMIVLSLVSSYVLAPITSATADECRDDYHYDHRHDSDHHTKDDHRFGRRWNKVPVGIIIGSGKAFVGTPTVLDASRSFDQDGSIVLYEWDVDEDGTWDITTTDPVASTTPHGHSDLALPAFHAAGRAEFVPLGMLARQGAAHQGRVVLPSSGGRQAPMVIPVEPWGMATTML